MPAGGTVQALGRLLSLICDRSRGAIPDITSASVQTFQIMPPRPWKAGRHGYDSPSHATVYYGIMVIMIPSFFSTAGGGMFAFYTPSRLGQSPRC